METTVYWVAKFNDDGFDELITGPFAQFIDAIDSITDLDLLGSLRSDTHHMRIDRKVRRYCERCGFNPAQVAVIRTGGKTLARKAKAWKRA